MRKLQLLTFLALGLFLAIGISSCEKDEPGSAKSHDYYTAFIDSEGGYYWVIDMDNEPGAGYDGSFRIAAWSLDGKKLGNKPSWSGKYKYQVDGNRIYITWDHQSMNTVWERYGNEIEMIGSGNPAAIEDYTFYYGAPEFQ